MYTSYLFSIFYQLIIYISTIYLHYLVNEQHTGQFTNKKRNAMIEKTINRRYV